MADSVQSYELRHEYYIVDDTGAIKLKAKTISSLDGATLTSTPLTISNMY